MFVGNEARSVATACLLSKAGTRPATWFHGNWYQWWGDDRFGLWGRHECILAGFDLAAPLVEQSRNSAIAFCRVQAVTRVYYRDTIYVAQIELADLKSGRRNTPSQSQTSTFVQREVYLPEDVPQDGKERPLQTQTLRRESASSPLDGNSASETD